MWVISGGQIPKRSNRGQTRQDKIRHNKRRRSARDMTPVEKAIWFVETQFHREISLGEIAGAAGVSRYHMARAFGAVIGCSLMRYARGRRLTEAARSLAAGAPDILAVALDAGYGSHEAFTRAFRDWFGITPETVRTRRSLDNLELVEAIRMNTTLNIGLEPPRFENGKALLIAGLGERYTFDTNQGIPAQWQRFKPYLGHITGQADGATYGVCCNFAPDGSFEYIAGVEVSSPGDLPKEFRTIRIAPQRYAVFEHRDHVSALRRTAHAIWNKWLPQSGHEAVEAPSFERYGAAFDPQAGTGAIEVWLPIKG
jgi:AraC family transcriptional regulator